MRRNYSAVDASFGRPGRRLRVEKLEDREPPSDGGLGLLAGAAY